MSGGFNPKVVDPNGWKLQTKSGEFQAPFYFGGSQVPINLPTHMPTSTRLPILDTTKRRKKKK